MSIKNINFNKGPALSLSNGFTLIEIMIAITLFTTIMILGTGAVLQTNAVHKKTQNMRSIMDNLNFIMEDMARNLRLGSSYRCLGPDDFFPIDNQRESPRDCDTSLGISFEGTAGQLGAGDQIVYIVQPSNNTDWVIEKSKDGGQNFQQITPDEVKIDPAQSGFTVVGSSSSDTFQPRVIIRLVGTVKYKELESKFNLETTVSQRLLDF